MIPQRRFLERPFLRRVGNSQQRPALRRTQLASAITGVAAIALWLPLVPASALVAGHAPHSDRQPQVQVEAEDDADDEKQPSSDSDGDDDAGEDAGDGADGGDSGKDGDSEPDSGGHDSGVGTAATPIAWSEITSRDSDDPWADPVLRWPDPLAESQLGTEATYYWFARDDRRSLLPAATDARPLGVWAGGDSMSGGPVYGFRQLIETETVFVFTEDIINSTGVVTDWFFDWVEYMSDEVAEGPYDVIVLAMGANDRQRFRQIRVPFGDPAWIERYQARVAELVSAAVGPGRLVLWVGLPPLQPRGLADLPSTVNPLAAAAIANIDGAIFIDSYETMAIDGKYARRLGSEHDHRAIRTRDGIHYTFYGGEVLTVQILAEIDRHSG